MERKYRIKENSTRRKNKLKFNLSLYCKTTNSTKTIKVKQTNKLMINGENCNLYLIYFIEKL